MVLQEIPAGLRQKRQQSIADSLHHMTACITYSMAKVIQIYKLYDYESEMEGSFHFAYK